jgi:hypothetical protein
MGMRCTQCGGEQLGPGFLEDTGESARGHVRWIEGPLQLGVFGGARKLGKPRRAISAYRCADCGHLELFALDPL